jgi:adenylylsulfate kinase-like enzyme
VVIWLIGLAGAGKTTIGREVHIRLKTRNPCTLFLDGDDVRAIMGDDLGHTLEDRLTNAWRICRLCKYLENQGADVVCAILSISHETQNWNRKNYSRYFEVFIDVPMEVLMERDQKGLYSGAQAGRLQNVVGVDIPFEPPPGANLTVKNDIPVTSPALLADEIVSALDERFQ